MRISDREGSALPFPSSDDNPQGLPSRRIAYANQPGGGADPSGSTTREDSPVSLYYLDDSGDSRMAVAGWLRVDVRAWRDAERMWKALRGELHADPDLNIQADDTLHAVNLAGGRGRPLHTIPGRGPTDAEKTRFRNVIQRGLRTVAAMPGVTAGAAYRAGATREELYTALVMELNRRHRTVDSFAMLCVDGNGTEHTLREAHRRLPHSDRHIIEDPFFAPARGKHLLQAADFVAYTAFQSVVGHTRRDFMKGWFAELLPAAEGPIAL
ncbi:DUF3800 domain-containing protein [Streptomyces sp. NPDC001889]